MEAKKEKSSENPEDIRRESSAEGTTNSKIQPLAVPNMQSFTSVSGTESFQSSNSSSRLTKPSTFISAPHESGKLVSTNDPHKTMEKNSENEIEPMMMTYMDIIFARYRRLMKHKRIPGSSLKQCWMVEDGVLTPLLKCSLSCQFHKMTKSSVVSKIAFDGDLENPRRPIGRFRGPSRIPIAHETLWNKIGNFNSAIHEQNFSSGSPDLTKEMEELKLQDTSMDTT